MSEEDSPDLTKSWVFVDPKKESEDPNSQNSGVEEVSENDNHVDSDTDSISVISESGCSYKTDEDELAPAPTGLESEEVTTPETEEVSPPEPGKVRPFETEEVSPPEPEKVRPFETEEVSPPKPDEVVPKAEVSTLKAAPEITEVPEPPRPANENERFEKLLYFATSTVCALILIGFSIIVQNYFYGSSNVNKFAADFNQKSDLPHYVSVKSQDDNSLKRLNFKRKGQSRFEETKTIDNFHDKIAAPSAQIKNNDLTVEDDVKSNYKMSKNKSPATKFNKENRDDSDKRSKNENKNFNEFKDAKKYRKEDKTIKDSKDTQDDENYDKRLKELKIKEKYLREKEKYLIEKEHHLMKREIKLNQGKQKNGRNKHEKTAYQKKHKEPKSGSEENENQEKKIKFKHKKYFDENNNQKSNKKYIYKEDKKRRHDHNQHKIIDDTQHKKRNVSGQWYIDLHKARNNIRKKERASDWVFDRAHLRSLKRNKAHWYFQWMVDRARLRVK